MIERPTPAHDTIERVLFAVWTFAAIIVGAAMGLLFGLWL